MGKLKELVEERESAYARYSDEILKTIEHNVVPAVLDMLDLNDNELEKLQWSNVQIVDDHLVLSGVIKYKEGDVVTDGDMTVTLDAAMALLLDKIIRVAIPADLAENASRQEIYQHLLDSQQQLRDEYEAAYGDDILPLEEALDEARRTQVGMDFGADFDYNDLTEEQKESLFISMTGSKPGDKAN